MPRINEREPAEYYDIYSRQYDRVRENAYHRLISELTLEFLIRFLPEEGRVLDLGCGTGINMGWVKKSPLHVVGFDLSHEMLKQARRKGNSVIRGNAVELPFRAEAFDLVYSFKVLPHIRGIDSTLEEVTRVLKPAGIAVLEGYNPYSLRGWLKKSLRPRLKVAPDLTEREVYTRFDSPAQMRKRLEKNYTYLASRGVILFFPFANAYETPFLGSLLQQLERSCCDSLLKYIGGFFILAGRKRLDSR